MLSHAHVTPTQLCLSLYSWANYGTYGPKRLVNVSDEWVEATTIKELYKVYDEESLSRCDEESLRSFAAHNPVAPAWTEATETVFFHDGNTGLRRTNKLLLHSVRHRRAAQDYYKRVLAIDSKHVKTLCNLGDLHYHEGRSAEAQTGGLESPSESATVRLTLYVRICHMIVVAINIRICFVCRRMLPSI